MRVLCTNTDLHTNTAKTTLRMLSPRFVFIYVCKLRANQSKRVGDCRGGVYNKANRRIRSAKQNGDGRRERWRIAFKIIKYFVTISSLTRLY